jgi:hypothetical protein
MTVPERLSAHLVSIQPSRRRAPKRTAKVRSHSDNEPNNARPKIPNKPTFSHRTAVHTPRSVAPRPCRHLQTSAAH